LASARPILRVGLTGGIASGKTTVGQRLAERGALVLDADLLAHLVMSRGGSAHDRILDRFGREILDDRGRIDRARLGERIFRDSDARCDLNAIVHPEVLREAERRIAGYTGHSPIAVFDAALLVETGAHLQFHKLLVVRCSEESQIRRLLARDGLTAEEARIRIGAQGPLRDKLAAADYVIDTEGTLRDTRAQVDRTYAGLLEDFESRFGPPEP
jgi:dephospho-CoA kinase